MPDQQEDLPLPSDEQQRLAELVRESKESGPATPWTPEDWATIRREGQRRLEKLIIEGLNSGDPIEVTPEWWEWKRAALIASLPAE